jgi:hypothetical protein
MHDNHLYNLMKQLVIEHKSLWHMKQSYLKDAKGCPLCTNLWKKMMKEKEANGAAMSKILKSHLA